MSSILQSPTRQLCRTRRQSSSKLIGSKSPCQKQNENLIVTSRKLLQVLQRRLAGSSKQHSASCLRVGYLNQSALRSQRLPNATYCSYHHRVIWQPLISTIAASDLAFPLKVPRYSPIIKAPTGAPPCLPMLSGQSHAWLLMKERSIVRSTGLRRSETWHHRFWSLSAPPVRTAWPR